MHATSNLPTRAHTHTPPTPPTMTPTHQHLPATPVLIRKQLLSIRPLTPYQLRGWVRLVFKLIIPITPLIPGHTAPFDYLSHAFFEDAPTPPTSPSTLAPTHTPPRDCIVWANRGGGKTFYAALATALDLIFKPGIEIKVLGGSLEQSQRMLAHLRALFSSEPFSGLLASPITEKRIRLANGSSAEVLAQSQTSVRGSRPQKIRCDEAELFDPDVWSAAQLVTRSKQCGPVFVRGCVEALSTFHKPFGIMAELIGQNRHEQSRRAPPTRRLFRWGVVDVLARCEPQRDCATCTLLPECDGRAKHARGHITIDDAITLKARSDASAWEAEMLCLRPQRTDAVYPEFSRERHVARFDPHPEARWYIGMDFGFRAPTAILYACLDPSGTLRILDERIARESTLAQHIRAIHDAPWPRPAWIAADPAGAAPSIQSGASEVELLRRAGLSVRVRRAPVERGLALVRTRLAPASGAPTLYIHERCTRLIESLERYHYPHENPASNTPVKDGNDHAADALRYLIVALDLHHATRTFNHD